MNNLLVTDCAIIKKEKIESIYTVNSYVIYWNGQEYKYDIYAKTNDGSVMLYSNIPQSALSNVMNNLANKLVN